MNLSYLLDKKRNSYLFRELSKPVGIDFCSNDYLGLSSEEKFYNSMPDLNKNGLSGQSSRLIRGQHESVQVLESLLSSFSHSQDALYMPSGYQTNLALYSSFKNIEGVTFFSDELNHASIIDGMTLSKKKKVIFNHCDISDLKDKLSVDNSLLRVISIESLYSMTGKHFPIKELMPLIGSNTWLIVDEAHATGVYNSGLAEKFCDTYGDYIIRTHTAGKALASTGGWVSCTKILKEWLVNESRPFIYSTSPSPASCLGLIHSIKYFEENKQELTGRLHKNCEIFSSLCLQKGLRLLGKGPIYYVVLGESKKALRASEDLQERGIDIRAIRYPTVSNDMAGLRISIHSNHIKVDIDNLIRNLQEVLR